MNPTILDLHFQLHSDDSFNVTAYVRNSSQPLATSRFEYRLNDLSQFEANRLEFNPRDPLGRLERLQAFGNKLYQKLFTVELQQLWQQQLEHSDFLTLCLRIHQNAKGLEAVPWETLHDGTEFIAAGAKTTITRLPLGIEPTTDLPAIPLPIKMLAFVSSPPDLPDGSRLNIEREQELLLEAVNTPAGQGKLHVDFEDEAKLEILESSLEAGYHILHFTGHGSPPENGGGLKLEDPDGKGQVYSPAEILQSLAKGFSTLRLAVISGCNTAQTLHTGGFRDLARELVEKKIPGVLAMQFSISDTGGLKLAEVLYPKIVTGNSLETAVHAARRALWLTDDPVLQADALALVLLTSNGNCLQTKAADAPVTNTDFKIDTGFQLGTLPQLGFGFYGRRKEYRQMRDALQNHRAVIIHGIGGIGKTSLIAHAADRLYHRRKRFNGVYAFDCAGSTLAPERILLELHRYFVLQEINALEKFLYQPLEPEVLAQILSQLLTNWPLLLIFDNFETQLERTEQGFRIADEYLRRFLAALVKATATNTKFVFTCRFLFELDERLGDVASLPLGDLSRPEAYSVMLKLPRLAKAGYAEKGTIYDTFGGHPFALVALDKYCQTSSVDKALQNAKAVHIKLREHLALELNYGRLTEQARELLNRLAAFRVSVPMEAADWVMQRDDGTVPRAVASGSDEETTKSLPLFVPYQDAIRELIEWGLLTPVYENDVLSRLDVHSLVRDFCRDKQADAWRDHLRAAASFYTNLTQQIPKAEKTPAMVWGEMEAFELLIEAKDYRDAAVLLSQASELLDRWGFGGYAERQYTRVLHNVENADYAQLIHNFGILQQKRGNYNSALKYYQQAIKIKEELGNMVSMGHSLHQLGSIEYLRGNYDAALVYSQHSLKIAEEQGDKAGVSASHWQIGMLLQDRGPYDEALKSVHETIAVLEELGNKASMATALHQLGNLEYRRRNYDAAMGYYQRSLDIKEKLDIKVGVANSLYQIGMVQEMQGNYGAALDYYQRALKISEDLDNREGVANTLQQIGFVCQISKDYPAALNYYQRSLKIKEELGNRAGIAISRGQIGRVLIETGRFAQAIGEWWTALIIFKQLESPDVVMIENWLKALRSIWGGFDAAWRDATGEEVPEWL